MEVDVAGSAAAELNVDWDAGADLGQLVFELLGLSNVTDTFESIVRSSSSQGVRRGRQGRCHRQRS